MDDKEREREENSKFKENRPENYHVHDTSEDESEVECDQTSG